MAVSLNDNKNKIASTKIRVKSLMPCKWYRLLLGRSEEAAPNFKFMLRKFVSFDGYPSWEWSWWFNQSDAHCRQRARKRRIHLIKHVKHP